MGTGREALTALFPGSCDLSSSGHQEVPRWGACSSSVRAAGMTPCSQCPCLKETKTPPVGRMVGYPAARALAFVCPDWPARL